MPYFRKRLSGALAESISLRRHASPPKQMDPFTIRCLLNGIAGLPRIGLRDKQDSYAEYFRKPDALRARAGSKKRCGECGKQPSAIAAFSIRVHAASMGKPLRRGQRDLNNFVAWRAAQPRDEPRPARVVVGMPPIRMELHTTLVAVGLWKVQRGVLIPWIHFPTGVFAAGMRIIESVRERMTMNRQTSASQAPELVA